MEDAWYWGGNVRVISAPFLLLSWLLLFTSIFNCNSNPFWRSSHSGWNYPRCRFKGSLVKSSLPTYTGRTWPPTFGNCSKCRHMQVYLLNLTMHMGIFLIIKLYLILPLEQLRSPGDMALPRIWFFLSFIDTLFFFFLPLISLPILENAPDYSNIFPNKESKKCPAYK